MNISLVDLSSEILKQTDTDTDKAPFRQQGHHAILLCLGLRHSSGTMPRGSFETESSVHLTGIYLNLYLTRDISWCGQGKVSRRQTVV